MDAGWDIWSNYCGTNEWGKIEAHPQHDDKYVLVAPFLSLPYLTRFLLLESNGENALISAVRLPQVSTETVSSNLSWAGKTWEVGWSMEHRTCTWWSSWSSIAVLPGLNKLRGHWTQELALLGVHCALDRILQESKVPSSVYSSSSTVGLCVASLALCLLCGTSTSARPMEQGRRQKPQQKVCRGSPVHRKVHRKGAQKCMFIINSEWKVMESLALTWHWPSLHACGGKLQDTQVKSLGGGEDLKDMSNLFPCPYFDKIQLTWNYLR